MGVMRLFQLILLISIIFISACSGLIGTLETRSIETPSEGFITKMPKPIFSQETNPRGYVGDGWNGVQYLGFVYLLSREDKIKHQSTIKFALENSPDMKVVSWYNKKNKTMGKVRVIESFPVSGATCRYYQVLIQKKNTARTAVYQACLYIGTVDWSYNYGSYIGKRY